MLDQQTISILHSLNLFGLARSFEERLADPKQAELSHAEFVGLLVQDEKTYRDNLRLRRLLKKAKLRQEAALEDIDYRASRGLSQQVVLELANPEWVAARRNVLLTGPTGIGKTYIACALGNSAARHGYTVLYLRAPRLFETLQQSRGDGSHLKTLAKLCRVQLLIIDDFLLTPLSDWERRETCWRSWRIGIRRPPPSSPASAPLATGIPTSATPPWPTLSVTGCCIMPIR